MKPKIERIGSTLKKEWRLVGIPDYNKFNPSKSVEVDLNKIVSKDENNEVTEEIKKWRTEISHENILCA